MTKSSVVPAFRRFHKVLGLPVGVALAVVIAAWSLPLWAASPPPPNGKTVTFSQLALAQTSHPLALSATKPAPVVPERFVPAPTPNLDIDAPLNIATPGTVVAPTLLGQKATYRGEGFVQGSSPQVVQQSRHMSLPGISLRVPLN